MKVLVSTAVALLLLILALWRPWESQSPPAALPPSTAEKAPSPPPNVEEEEEDPGPAVTPVAPPPPGPDLSALTPEELQRVRDAIDNVEFVLRDYSVALGGNPVGTNAEITAALRGDNLKQLKLDTPGGSSVNDSGELCDPWGTPWFFHQLSGTKMELRSAGPDRKLYTKDDFVR
jgi:hypothetical protein